MNLISITPVHQAKWMLEQPMIMALSHLTKYPEYVNAIKNRKKDIFVILDNSLIELGESVTLDTVLEAAEKIDANEIILRDVFKNGPATIERVKEDINYLKEKNLIGKYQLMAVCHGNNLKEFKESFDQLEAIPEVDTIGIPKVVSTWCGERSELFNIFKNSKKNIHFLGSWYSLKEIIDMPSDVFKKVRSCDTCLPFLDCVQNKGFYDDRDGTIDLEEKYNIPYDRYKNFLYELEDTIVGKQIGR